MKDDQGYELRNDPESGVIARRASADAAARLAYYAKHTGTEHVFDQIRATIERNRPLSASNITEDEQRKLFEDVEPQVAMIAGLWVLVCGALGRAPRKNQRAELLRVYPQLAELPLTPNGVAILADAGAQGALWLGYTRDGTNFRWFGLSLRQNAREIRAVVRHRQQMKHCRQAVQMFGRVRPQRSRPRERRARRPRGSTRTAASPGRPPADDPPPELAAPPPGRAA